MSVLTELLIPFTVIISILFLIQYKWNRRHMVKLASLLPGPPTVPLIGNLLYFFNCTHEDFIYKISDLLKQYGPGGPMRFWLGNNLVIAISDPKDLEVILSHPKIIDKHQLFQYFQSRSLGAFTLSGENWRRHRRFANKMFHRNLMEWYLTIFNEQGHELEKYLEKKLPTETFDISHPIMRCTLDTICRTAIGVNMNLQKNSDLTFPDDLTVSSEIIIERIYKPWLHTDVIFKLTSLGREMFKCISRIHKFTEQVISKRRQILENKNSQSLTEIDLTENNPPDKLYIDHMFDFANTENLNDHDIALAALDIFIGGADTSAIGDSYVLAFLGMHKEWQDKIHKEQDEIFHGSSRDITTHDLDNMVVLEMVIKEILRLYTAPHTVRDLKEDVKTENYILPAGATIYVLTYLVHRDPRFWSHPEEFYPNHFLPENVAKRPKYSYLPFSSGPRQCPGSKYGMISMKVVLAYILRKFRIECDLKFEEMKYKPSLMLEHVGGYPIRLIPRTKFYHN